MEQKSLVIYGRVCLVWKLNKTNKPKKTKKKEQSDIIAGQERKKR